MFDLKQIQDALRQFKFDGWLFFDFHSSNVLARRILDFSEGTMNTRRFFYFIPASGDPQKLVHRIESGALDHLPGEKHVYLRWQELERELKRILGGQKRVAMEYSPRNAIPYVSKVDGGTVDLVKACGVEVVSSGDLIQLFEATLDEEQWRSHLTAEKHVLAAIQLGFDLIATRVKAGKPPRETEVQKAIMDYFQSHQMITDHPAIVAVGANSGSPHYEPQPKADSVINEGDFVLLDAWGKLEKPRSVFADYTRVGFVGRRVPGEYADIFRIVAEARDAGVAVVRDAMAAGRTVRGFEVDDATRGVIEKAGHGKYFVHRTGHNISQDLHGNGTHMDNLETHDERLVLRRTCFSVEPGIYTEKFGVRSEVNVYVDADGHVHVTGDPQQEILAIS